MTNYNYDDVTWGCKIATEEWRLFHEGGLFETLSQVVETKNSVSTELTYD